MKKALALSMVLILVLSLLSGCSSNKQASEGDQSQTLTVAMMPFGGNVPAQYAFDQGWFKEEGLNVKFVMLANGADINEALAAKKVDVAVSGLAMVMSLASGTCKWVAETNNSGGMGLYVREDSPVLKQKGQVKGKPNMYGSPDTLKGITILGQLGTSSQYAAEGWAKQFGLTGKDIKFVNVGLGTDLQTFIAGNGDGLSASRPFSFQAARKGFVEAASFEDATGISLNDGIVVRTEVLAQKKAAVEKFLKQYFRAAEALQNNAELRFTYSQSFFAKNGRTYSDDDMRAEIKCQHYILKKDITEPSYAFGEAMIKIGQFYSEAGKIEKEKVANIVKSFEPGLINSVLGINMKVAKE